MPGAPDYVKWMIGSDVRPEYVEASIEGTRLFHEYIESLGMSGIKTEVRLSMFHDQDKFIAAYEARTGGRANRNVLESTAVAGEGGINVNALRLEERKTSLESLRKITAHEMVHVLQNELAGVRGGSDDYSIPETGPRWLTEGIAEFLAYQAMSAADNLDYDTKRIWEFVERGRSVDKPLAELETMVGIRAARGSTYVYFLLAAELLAAHTDQSTLIHYYTLLQPGTTWQQAFKTAFGMPVEEFYEWFEEHRAAGFPCLDCPPQTVDDYILWKVGDDVSPTAEAETRETVLAVHDYAVDLGLSRLGSLITIFVYRNLDTLGAEFEATAGRILDDSVGPDFAAGRNPFANGSNWVAVNTSADRYREWPAETRERQLGGHFSDALLREMSGLPLGAQRDQVPPGGPAWLLEGSRKFLTYQALRPSGPESCDPTRGRYAHISESVDTPLSETETSEDFWALENPSAHGFLAVELLAEQAGPEAVISYYASLRPGTIWQEAFQAAFGMTVAESYQLFEERRSAGFPRPRCETLPPLVTMPGAPEYIKWTIGDEVSAELRQYAVDAARLIHEYATSRGLPDIESEIEIHIHGDLDTLATIYADITGWSFNKSRDFWENRGGGVAGAGWVMMPEWTHRDPSEEPIKITRGITHELFHSYQAAKYSLVGSHPYGPDDETPKHGPRWLLEGSANFFMYKAMDAGGFLSYDSERLKVVDKAKLVVKPLGIAHERWSQGWIRSRSIGYGVACVDSRRRRGGDPLLHVDSTRNDMAGGVPGGLWNDHRRVLRVIRGTPRRRVSGGGTPKVKSRQRGRRLRTTTSSG